MTKFYLVLFLFFFGLLGLFSQPSFDQVEKELAYHADVMVNAYEGKHRQTAKDQFNKLFYEVLMQEESSQYAFDSIKFISKKEPKDRSFRIFTWTVKISDSEHLHFGALQKAGKTYIFNDVSTTAESYNDEEFRPDYWLGAYYYNIMDVEVDNGSKYYLLFGVNKWNKYENLKLVDVLFFTKDGEPYFGKPIFKNEAEGKVLNRLIFKYAADAHVSLNYNPGMNMIMVDHLIKKMSRQNKELEVMVPDGSYVGYEWDKKYWQRVDKIATEVMNDAPNPKPILDKRKGKKIMGN